MVEEDADTAGTTTWFDYDANGSLTSTDDGTTITSYGYDVRNKLVELAAGEVTLAQYGYDDAGNRVSETTAAGTTLYLTDTNNPTGYSQPLEVKTGATPATTTTYFIGDRVLGQADAATPAVLAYLLSGRAGITEGLAGSRVTIQSAHGARHLAGTGLTSEAVESAITGQVRQATAGAAGTGSFWGRVTVNGRVVEYRAFTLPDGTINVGTYYPVTP